MMIANLNRFFAKHGLVAYIVLIGAMVVPLVFYFADGTSALGQGGQQDTMVARMYGKPVYRGAFQNQMTAVQVNYGLRYPFGNQPEQELLAEQAFNRLRALHEARSLRIDKVSDEQLRERLKTMFETPVDENGEFLAAGAPGGADQKLKFNNKLFQQFKTNFLPRYGVTAREFDEIVRNNIVIDRLESRIRESVTVSDREAFLAYQRSAIQCEAEVLNFRSNSYQAEAKIDDKEAEEYFRKNIGKYRVPDQNQLLVTTFRSSDYTDKEDIFKITEEQVRARYDADKSKLYSKSEVRARHILIKADEKAPKKDKDKARKKAEDILKLVKDGGNFIELAKEHSEGPTKVKGGDLGWFARGRMVPPFDKAVFAMKSGETSDIVETRFGYHIILRVAAHTEQPLSEVKARIESALKREVPAQNYYNKNIKTEYSVSQAKASQIMKTVAATATDEEKAEAKAELEEIREKLVKTPTEFANLARKESDDTRTKNKGGDLGWLKKTDRTLQKEVIDAIFAAEKGDLSEVIETRFGYHLVKVSEKRDVIPFDDVKSEITRKLRTDRLEAGKKGAREAAVNFAIKIHTSLESVPTVDKPDAFRKTAGELGVKLVETGYFRPTDRSIKGLSIGGAATVVEVGSKLSVTNPLSDVVTAGNDYVVACWLSKKDSYQPKFREEDGKTLSPAARKAQQELKNEKAMDLAMDAAKRAHEGISADIASDKAWPEAAGAHKFDKVPKFSLAYAPRGVANGSDILEICKETPGGTLSAPKKTSNGVVVVYVAEHTLPNIDSFELFKTRQLQFFARSRQQMEIESYYEFLKKKSATQLTEDWKFLEGNSDDTEADEQS